MDFLFIIGIVVVAIIALCIFLTMCYRKAPPTEALVITGMGREPKVICGKGSIVIPVLQRVDKMLMRIMKLDVKTPATGVKTSEGVSVFLDSVVTVQVYSNSSVVTDKDLIEADCESREEFIRQKQQAAISNFLGYGEDQIAFTVNDSLQGNLREIVATMSVMDLLTKRKEFAEAVMANARPDLAKMGLEIVTFNIQDIRDAEDQHGRCNGVIEAIGVQREMEVKRDAEKARAEAEKDISIARADAARTTAEREAEAKEKIAEANQRLELRKAELKREEDEARAKAEAAGLIEQQIQEKTRRQAEADVEIAAQEKEIQRAEKQAEVEQRKLDAEIRKKADAEKYKTEKQAEAAKYAMEQKAQADKIQREQDAEAKLIEARKSADADLYRIQREAEAKKTAADADMYEAMRKAQGITAIGEAEAKAIEAKGLAEAQAIEKKAEAQQKMGDASKLEMMYAVLPQVAEALASVLNGVDSVTLYGTDTASNLMSSMTQGMNQFMKSVQDGTGASMDANALAGALVGANLAGGNTPTKPTTPKK